MDADHRDLRKRYDEAFAAVRHVVNEADPECLMQAGFPVDEYDPEVAQLVSLVLGPSAPSEAEVVAVWQRWFGDRHHVQGEAAAALTDDLGRLHGTYSDS